MLNIKAFILRIYFRLRFGVIIHNGCKVSRKVVFEGCNAVFPGTEITESNVGCGTYFGSNCRIRKSKIGRYCSIADGVTLSFGLHPSRDFVSTYPAFFKHNHPATFKLNCFYNKILKFSEHKYVDEEHRYCCVIGNDVWLGDDVKIMDGVTIGDGVIVGAGSIVTRDCEPYGIYVGVPAKLIRHRFNADQVDFLLRLQWWLRDENWIREHSILFGDIDSMICEIDC